MGQEPSGVGVHLFLNLNGMEVLGLNPHHWVMVVHPFPVEGQGVQASVWTLFLPSLFWLHT